MGTELDIGCSDELWHGELQRREVSGVRLLLVRVGESVLAYEDRCPHLGVALSEGSLCGRTLTCRAHHWQYDVATGQGVNPRRVRLTPIRARQCAGRLLVAEDDVLGLAGER
jgi:toluene monooxygenase system ferredoxin subunit